MNIQINNDPQYELFDTNKEPNNIVFHTGKNIPDPLLTISEDGFYVRGVKVPVDEKEAEAVYKAFKKWLVEAELRRPW